MLPTQQPADLVITPTTWEDGKKHLSATATDLLNMVGWYGSTHASARWRKDPQFLKAFESEHICGFDPQVDDWDPSYSAIEAEVMATAAVVIIRLENNELLNGSLGSIAEIGLALTSAALRGQIVVVSVEAGLLTSLNEPGAIAQYMMLEMFLEQWEKSPEFGGLLRIHRGDDLAQLGQMACTAASQQMKQCQARLDFDEFLLKKARRQHNYPMRVLLGGSGGPYAKVHDQVFLKKKQALLSPYLAEGHATKILSEGAIADAWNIPYGSVDKIGVALATRTLLAIENEYKREADVLLLPIMAEAASKAAATEIGLLLVSALRSGQWIKIYFEPFDAVDYIYRQLDQADLTNCTTEKQMRLALRQAGVEDAVLATATQVEISEAVEIFQALNQARPPTFSQLKSSLLGQTEAFRAADNIRRVRILVQAHLERLAASPRFSDFFTYSNRIEY